MESNIKQFLNMTSKSQLIFKWSGDDYIFLKGQMYGLTVKQLLQEYPDETKEMIIELFYDENSNYHTKNICKEIVKLHNIKK